MTSREWDEADQDDADRVRAWLAQDAQEPTAAAELEEGAWFLDDQNRRLMELLSAETAKCKRLTTGSEYIRAEIVNLRAERDAAWAQVGSLEGALKLVDMERRRLSDEVDKQDAEISRLTQALAEKPARIKVKPQPRIVRVA